MIQQQRSRVLSQTDVRVSNSPVRVGDKDMTASVTHTHSSPEVSVQRNSIGDVVEIHVRCSCGETTVINCQYDG